jgi:3-oxoacyl-[acyl-carrier-protein] synthase II
MKAVIVASDIITPYGKGIEQCWAGLMARRSAISRIDRFETGAFHSSCGGVIPGLRYPGGDSLVMQMLALLLDPAVCFPRDALLLLATIKGEIDFLEQSILGGGNDPAASVLDRLLGRVIHRAGTDGGGMIVSSACTSSAAALAQAGAMIRCGHRDCVLVVACDSVTEFIFSGFSALMALDAQPARPFDRNRGGLNVGEAAGYLLLMSEERAIRENREIRGELCGWGMSDDANHMTGPSRDSGGLIRAMEGALESAACARSEVGFISAHGTGTPYNDAMEMKAFRTLFTERPLPVYSVKGGIGHTMGAAGLVETTIALHALRQGMVPPTVNLVDVDDDAAGWVSGSCSSIASGRKALVTNAGFGGVNSALVLAV